MSLLPGNIESLSGAARFLLAAVVYSLLLLFLALVWPVTVSLIARVLPFIILLPCILLAASLLLWLKDFFLPSLSSPLNTRRRMAERYYYDEQESEGSDREFGTPVHSRRVPRNWPATAYGFNRGANAGRFRNAARTDEESGGGFGVTRLQQIGLLLGCFLLASVIWLSIVHLLLKPQLSQYLHDKELPLVPRAMAKEQIARWNDTKLRNQHISAMRAMNPEWDLMART